MWPFLGWLSKNSKEANLEELVSHTFPAIDMEADVRGFLEDQVPILGTRTSSSMLIGALADKKATLAEALILSFFCGIAVFMWLGRGDIQDPVRKA